MTCKMTHTKLRERERLKRENKNKKLFINEVSPRMRLPLWGMEGDANKEKHRAIHGV